MIIDISDSTFKDILNDEKLFLPIRWDGFDFSSTLDNLFNFYIKQLEILTDDMSNRSVKPYVELIKKICGLLTKTVSYYLNGFPSKSYSTFEQVMDLLMINPLKIFQKNVMEQFKTSINSYGEDDDLKLFRVVNVEDNRPYQRMRVFHTPYNLRSKVSTCRYSIAGYPSLYLGTSLALCCEEINMNPHQNYALASIFKLEELLSILIH